MYETGQFFCYVAVDNVHNLFIVRPLPVLLGKMQRHENRSQIAKNFSKISSMEQQLYLLLLLHFICTRSRAKNIMAFAFYGKEKKWKNMFLHQLQIEFF